ncbi:C-type lectin domain family 4 member C-like isoform X2 [Sparus aurata]|uniref:C-type lectin domain family 4 member C-like isoform X2 n=1 Tax=Sparus aurata TaxID=8175 RepID=UPI0011C164C5|nr:C-type lectin domain family 4 member C-like isoform X2 [Sparus aurata]XP_030250566.1 C-type lectin domain family 4 member C-like isoform X2 [Sparus aurata]XP_030250568.1 C-type lectin domain family 4 member C-like isoform X2 [Sparus aurata]
MEEELNYASVTFRSNSVSTHEKPNDLEIIYDEVKSEQQGSDTRPVKKDNKKKAPMFTLLHVVAAVLGIICVSLLSVLITLSIYFKAVVSERLRENSNLTAQKLQLWTEKTDLERRNEELTRERDGLNWTIGVILEHKDFPVERHCPQKVCKPCLDDWLQFQTNCYFFPKSEYSSGWNNWTGSREECRKTNADLVVIDSQEEQEFINNHTETYHDEKHGYWIGLSRKDVKDGWKWVDGSNVTVTYWTQNLGYSKACALTLPRAARLANWDKVGCKMRNRWICETRALIKGSAPKT